MDSDDRHRREQKQLRAERKDRKAHKSASQIEKEKRRKEYTDRVLKEKNQKRGVGTSGSSSSSRPQHRPHPPKHAKPKPKPPSEEKMGSKFQALLTNRASGFLIEMNFRNAPPRPPVGPCFVGLGLDGELNDKWTRYKHNNAIEANYSWKLHAEPDLGVPLAPSAMDYEGCYVDPSSKTNKKKKNDAYDELFDDGNDDDDNDDKEEENTGPAPLHPDDEALINWKGYTGDSNAEELQRLRDKARQEARLQGTKGGAGGRNSTSGMASKLGVIAKKNKSHDSRVLNEAIPIFMKKTVYLDNESHKVHDFKSQAKSKQELSERIRITLENKAKKLTVNEAIEESFTVTNNIRNAGSKRPHPTKKNVEAVFEIPLLPDTQTWGHNFIHVVLDNLPKLKEGQSEITQNHLERAFVTDVSKGNTQKMECNLLTSNNQEMAVDDDTTTSKQLYNAVQRYDLEVVGLKQEDAPHSDFIFVIDEENGTASYHPITSRVKLSTGRPADHGVGSRQISKRLLGDDDVRGMEERLAEIDSDLARKYNIGEGDGDGDDGPEALKPFGDHDSSSDEEGT